jgi:hypothetical protein
MIYAVEAWILSFIGWAWLCMRNMWGPSLLDDFVIYSTMGLSTLNLILAAITGPANITEISKAYCGAILTLWVFYAYSIMDSLPLYKFGAHYAPTNTTKICCPNADIQKTYRQLLFAGSDFFLLPSSVTASYLTIQMLIAGAGVAFRGTSAWPGISGILYTGCLLCTFLQLYFGNILTHVCPDTMFRLVLINHPVISYGYIIAGAWFGMLLSIGLESMTFAKPIQIAIRFLQLLIVLTFTASVGFAAYYRGMLTLGLSSILGYILVPTIIHFLAGWFIPVEPFKQPIPTAPPMLESLSTQRPSRKTTRWVLPIQTNTSRGLPIQTNSSRMHILEKKAA